MNSEPPSVSVVESSPPLATVAWVMIILTTGLFLLRELGVILKPLLLAVLFAYVIIPFHQRVKQRVPGRFAIVAVAVLFLLALAGLTAIVQSNARTLYEEFPALSQQAKSLIGQFTAYCGERFPSSTRMISELTQTEQNSENVIRDLIGRVAGVAAETASVGVVVGLYLMFMLVEAGRFPQRVRSAFSDHRADQIMQTIASINAGIADYLRAKVYASLTLAVPIFVVLFVFGTRFALVWAVLNFLANFIPYLGAMVGYSLPTLYALLQFGFGWEFVTIATILLTIHILTATVGEPAIIGKAVGVSPLVILISLAFWGYCWGLTGMFLAVPLTVIAKIICSHIEATQPIARLVSDE
ncbi:AI-2E family transporter [Zavarzinella formosa]|uniref:AI-2E family transporter n=1 Tax=Zavarzinella formosa TaxID=360055 RepID=UPI00031AB48F|nr:AI-2E family transporter [Zavarzinella formosa]